MTTRRVISSQDPKGQEGSKRSVRSGGLISRRGKTKGKAPADVDRSSPRTISSNEKSKAEDFIDARSMPPNQAVSNRIGADQDQQGMGVFVRPKVIDFQARVQE